MRRRLLLEQGRLPSGYEELECLRNDGQSWIRLPLVQAGENTIAKFYIVDESDTLSERSPIGQDTIFELMLVNGTLETWAQCQLITPPNLTPYEKNTKIYVELIILGYGWLINNVLYGSYANNRYHFTGLQYELIIEYNGEIILDFVPCENKIENKLGFYETINDVFYENVGIGNFSKVTNV